MTDVLFSLRVTPIGRTALKGSAAAAGAAGARLRYNLRCDAVAGVVARGIPTRSAEAAAWMDAQEATDRANARICDSVVVALPHQLTHAQRMDLVSGWCDEMSRGVPYIAAIHRPSREGDRRNHHAHVVFRDREPGTGKRLMRSYERNSIGRFCATWERHVNLAMEAAGLDGRTDRRSFVERGIDRIPQIHVGPKATAAARKKARGSARETEPTSKPKVVRKGVGRTAANPTRVIDYPGIDGPGTRADENVRRAATNAARERAAAQAALQRKLADFMARTAGRGIGPMPGMTPLPAAPALGRGAARMAPAALAAQLAMGQALGPATLARPSRAVPWRASAAARELAMEPLLRTPDVLADREARAMDVQREREAARVAADAARRRKEEAGRAAEAAVGINRWWTVAVPEGVDATTMLAPLQGRGVDPSTVLHSRGSLDVPVERLQAPRRTGGQALAYVADRATALPASRDAAATPIRPAGAAAMAEPAVPAPQPPVPNTATLARFLLADDARRTSDSPPVEGHPQGRIDVLVERVRAPASTVDYVLVHPTGPVAPEIPWLPRTISDDDMHFYVAPDPAARSGGRTDGIEAVMGRHPEMGAFHRSRVLFEEPRDEGPPRVWVRLTYSVAALRTVFARLRRRMAQDRTLPDLCEALKRRLRPAAAESDAAYRAIIFPWQRARAEEAEAARAAAAEAAQSAKDDAIRADHAAAAAARPAATAEGKATATPKAGVRLKGGRLPKEAQPKPASAAQAEWARAQRAKRKPRGGHDEGGPGL